MYFINFSKFLTKVKDNSNKGSRKFSENFRISRKIFKYFRKLLQIFRNFYEKFLNFTKTSNTLTNFIDTF